MLEKEEGKVEGNGMGLLEELLQVRNQLQLQFGHAEKKDEPNLIRK